jgi:hypothetical protein
MPKKTASKGFEKKVKEIVRKELATEIEHKTAVIGTNSTIVDTASIPDGDVQASDNFHPIMPLLDRGSAGYNQRLGSEVRLKHIDLKYLFNWVDGDGSNNYRDQAIGVRIMILKQKDNMNNLEALTDFRGNQLLENGAISTAGASAFVGNTFNLLQKINRDRFTVRYDKVHYMQRAREFNSSNGSLSHNYAPKPATGSKRLTFGKQGLKLKYATDSATKAVNFPYFICIGYASTMGSSTPSSDLIEFSYTANAKYTDA